MNIKQNADNSRRVEIMRKRVLDEKRSRALMGMGNTHFKSGEYNGITGVVDVIKARSLKASENETSWQRRRGLITKAKMESWTFLLDEHEQFVGRPVPAEEFSTEEMSEAGEILGRYPWPGGQTGHCELYIDDAMEKGIGWIIQDVSKRAEGASGEKGDTYLSFVDTLEGLSEMLLNMATCADKACENASSQERAEELAKMAAACRKVSREAPQTVREALQLFWAIWLGVTHGDGPGCICLGHIDRWLYPVFKKDREQNNLTYEDTLFYIENIYLLVNACWADGSALPAMVGGKLNNGDDTTNELSYISFEALRNTKLGYPTVGICWHEDTPQALTDLAVELISKGYSTPAFFGDETIQKGLLEFGVPQDEACNYINSACVEITPSGSSAIYVASPYFNMCAYLMDEITDNASGSKHSETFEDFLTGYKARVSKIIEEAAETESATRRKRQESGRYPLQSVFTNDCIENGHDIDDGGARYNWVECSFVGLANLADSLAVIRNEIFKSGNMTLGEMKKILDNNFSDTDNIRQRFLLAHPKYGQDKPEVDTLFSDIVKFTQTECAKHKVYPHESHFVPGAFCWVMHERLGRECGATPDGRLSGQPFADGCGPAQGRESCGPTAAILSTTSWEHSPMIGGLAYNMKFNSSLFDSQESVNRLRDLILTYLRRGGFETQVNVVDHETLVKAKENPEEYRDLVVRIGGYTDYFVRLSEQMQDEVMLRTEFCNV